MVKRILNQEEPFRVFIGIALFIGSLLTYGLVLLFSSRGSCEAFENEDGSLGGILATVQRVSSVLLQPGTWTDRIEMSNMTPVELARRYLKSQAKEEDGETE